MTPNTAKAMERLRQSLTIMHDRYYDTTHYITVVVTMILIMQLYTTLEGVS